jgi:hypothetical protein
LLWSLTINVWEGFLFCFLFFTLFMQYNSPNFEYCIRLSGFYGIHMSCIVTTNDVRAFSHPRRNLNLHPSPSLSNQAFTFCLTNFSLGPYVNGIT